MVILKCFASKVKASADRTEPGDVVESELDPAEVESVAKALYGRRGSVVRLRGGRELHAVGDVDAVRALLGLTAEE